MSERKRRIRGRLINDLYDQPLMQNNLRGVWVEYLVADALGANCRIVSHDWNAWDLEFGNSRCTYPDRIRLQVKNTARTQPWHKRTGQLTECQWSLKLRRRPSYFEQYNPGVPREDYGFLCDAFLLCHHPIEDWSIADHQDPR